MYSSSYYYYFRHSITMASSGMSYMSSKDTANFARMCCVVVDIVADVLRAVLQNRIQEHQLQTYLQTNTSAKLWEKTAEPFPTTTSIS